jgi:hypothetical protein
MYAPCRMFKRVILMMRTVVEPYGDTIGCERAREFFGVRCETPSWEMPQWSVDCEQVGKLANGLWVAYDYGSE